MKMVVEKVDDVFRVTFGESSRLVPDWNAIRNFFENSTGEGDLASQCKNQPTFIHAIKHVRAVMGWDLKTAKNWIEKNVGNSTNWNR